MNNQHTSTGPDGWGFARNAFAVGMVALLAACSTHSPPQPDQALIRAFAARGYASVEHASVSTSTSHWAASGQTAKLVLARPARTGAVPVVIYLPGLGEASEAGERWRTAWASAGYAVVSVQLLDDDATAWRSDLALNGEFKALGRQRYAGAAVSRRVQLLADLVVEGQRRSAAGDPGWQELDWSKLAIAGFDLGAYTAMAVAGEHVPNAEDAAGRVQIRAAIALSPYASFAAGSLDTRYRDIHTPVMSVTSDVDVDALGLVEGGYLRNAPFNHMNGPDKFLLSLQGLPHSELSGAAHAKGDTAESEPTKPSDDGTGNASSSDTGQPRRGGKRGGPGEGAKPSRDRAGGADRRGPAGLSPTALQLRLIAAQDISTAFLDAYVKNDSLAREWLASNATRWLGHTGELKHK